MPNQHFYDFQWRALNLCTEFYQAAEELIVSVIVSRKFMSSQLASHRRVHPPLSSHSVIMQDPRQKSIRWH